MEMTAGNVKLYYEQMGNAGRKILLLHGWGCSTEHFALLGRELSRDYRVTMVPFRATAKSGRPPEPWGVPEYAACIREMMLRLGLPLRDHRPFLRRAGGAVYRFTLARNGGANGADGVRRAAGRSRRRRRKRKAPPTSAGKKRWNASAACLWPGPWRAAPWKSCGRNTARRITGRWIPKCERPS